MPKRRKIRLKKPTTEESLPDPEPEEDAPATSAAEEQPQAVEEEPWGDYFQRCGPWLLVWYFLGWILPGVLKENFPELVEGGEYAWVPSALNMCSVGVLWLKCR